MNAFCKKHIRSILVLILSLVGIIATSSVISLTKDSALSQNEADRWSAKDLNYHQISAFSSGQDFESISRLRNTIATKLGEAGFTNESTTGRLWIDAFYAMAEGQITRKSDTGFKSKDNIMVMGVGGDFFQFHLLDFICGSYFEDQNVMKDGIVLDRETAWSLFGAYDVIGKSVSINGQSFVVSGVYDMSNSRDEEYARDGKSYIFISYEYFNSIYEGMGITGYETVIPNPIKNFAFNLIKDNVDEDSIVVDNTNRFSFLSLAGKYKKLSHNFMKKNSVILPYWENEALAIEWKIFRCMLIRLIFVLVLSIILVRYAIKLFRIFRKRFKGKLKDILKDIFGKLPKRKSTPLLDNDNVVC